MAQGACSGVVHPCISHKDDQSACTAAGCIYVPASGACGGSHNACSTYSSQSTCVAHACTWTPTTTTTGGGGVQSVIGIFPRAPLGGDLLYSEEVQLKVEIFFAGEPSNGASVKANSSMFGEVILEHEKNLPDGIYVANVTIKDATPGSKRIVYTVEQSVQYNEAFILVELKPSLEITAGLDDIYYKNNLMKFDGTVLDKDKKPKNNSIVKISGYQDENKVFYIETFTNKEGNFYSEYLIKYGDPEGNWKILIEAESEEKEYGDKSLSTQIGVPSGALYYSVNFLSPLKEKTFKRGEVVPITIEVKDINEFVNEASVIVYSPSGDSITLNEVGDGKYFGNYIIKPDDLMGNWFLVAEVKKHVGTFVRVGGANIPIIVGPTEIKFNILSPVSDVVYTNSRLKIKVKLTYPDGSLVKGADLNAVLSDSNEAIPLLEISDGIYEGSHFIGTEFVGTSDFKISADDINKNFGTLSQVIFVRKRSFVGNILAFIGDIAKQYWWAIVTFLVAAFLIYWPTLDVSWIKRKIRKSTDEKKNIKEMQIETEKKYYKEGRITKKEFRHIMEEYEERLTKAKENEKIYKKGLIEKLEKIRKKNL